MEEAAKWYAQSMIGNLVLIIDSLPRPVSARILPTIRLSTSYCRHGSMNSKKNSRWRDRRQVRINIWKADLATGTQRSRILRSAS